MGIDIDSFLNKLEAKEDAQKSREEMQNKLPQNPEVKINLDFDKNVGDTLKEIESGFKEKNLEQLKEIYNDLKKFDENIPSKFLNIQNIGSNTINLLSTQYSEKLLKTLDNNASIIIAKIKSNNTLIEEDFISKEYRVCIKLIKENKEFIKQFPNEFSNEKHELNLLIKKYEIKVNQEIRNFKVNDSQIIKKKIFTKLRELKVNIESNNIENIEASLNQIELINQKIPGIFRSVFTDENIIIQKAIANAETKIVEINNKRFNQKEKEIKIVQDKFQSSIIKKDLNSALLLYNEVLLLFEDLPNTNLKKKITYLNIISKLHSQLNSLYVKNNVELLLGGYNNSKVIEEARNYIDHIEITKKVSLENITIIYNKLKNLPKSTHIEQDTMIKKYEILLNKVNSNHDKKENSNEIVHKAEEYLSFIKETQNVSESMVLKNISDLESTKETPKSKELLKKFRIIKEKINLKKSNNNKTGFNQYSNQEKGEVSRIIQTTQEKKPNEKSILENSQIKIDKNVAEELEVLYKKLKEINSKKEKVIIYKKIVFYLDLVNLPKFKKEKILEKIKKTYEEQ
jgi:hypothetical protein